MFAIGEELYMIESTTKGHPITTLVALPEEVTTKQTGGNLPQPIMLGVTAKVLGCRWERVDESPCCMLAGGVVCSGGGGYGRGGGGGRDGGG